MTPTVSRKLFAMLIHNQSRQDHLVIISVIWYSSLSELTFNTLYLVYFYSLQPHNIHLESQFFSHFPNLLYLQRQKFFNCMSFIEKVSMWHSYLVDLHTVITLRHSTFPTLLPLSHSLIKPKALFLDTLTWFSGLWWCSKNGKQQYRLKLELALRPDTLWYILLELIAPQSGLCL